MPERYASIIDEAIDPRRVVEVDGVPGLLEPSAAYPATVVIRTAYGKEILTVPVPMTGPLAGEAPADAIEAALTMQIRFPVPVPTIVVEALAKKIAREIADDAVELIHSSYQ